MHKPRHNRTSPLDRAFSLLETLLVLAMLALLAGLAVPRYGQASSRYQADLAAQRVAADLDLARSRARATGAKRTVTFSVVGGDYRIVGMEDLDRTQPEYRVKVSDQPYGATLLSASFGGRASVIFDGYGIPDGGGQVVLQVGDCHRTIVLDGTSGKARVQ